MNVIKSAYMTCKGLPFTKVLTSFILILMLLFVSAPARALDKKIMVINSYNKGFNWVEGHNGVLRRGLAGQVDFSFYYLDYKRLSKKDCDLRVAEVRSAVDREKPDLVVVTDDYALKTFGQFLVDRGIPVVFLGINGNARGYVDNIHKITGVFERPLVKRSVAYLAEIIGPGKYIVLMDDSLSARVFVRESLHGQMNLAVAGARARIKLVKNFNDWKEMVKNARKDGYSCILVGTYHVFRDDQGRHISSIDVIKWTSRHAPVPVFGLWDLSVGKGMAIGGYVVSGVAQGREALKIVKKVLAGEKVENIQPVIGKNGVLLFSSPEMKRWNISLPQSLTSKGFLIKIIR